MRNMGTSDTQRILLYTALFASGSVIACPALGLGVGAQAAGAALAALSGNTLASEIHGALTRASPNSAPHDDLQKLVGTSLALLIERFETEQPSRSLMQYAARKFWHRDSALAALCRAARGHVDFLQLTGESAAIQDTEIHKAFIDRSPVDPRPLIPADEWFRHIGDLCTRAHLRNGKTVWLRDGSRHQLAAYIAPRFASAVREVVVADLDPNAGTGGRAFVALHLDLTRAIFVAIAKADVKADETLESLDVLRKQLADLSKCLTTDLTNGQRALPGVVDLVTALRKERDETHKQIRLRFDELGRKNEDNQAALMAKLNELLAQKPSLTSSSASAEGEPLPARRLTPDEQRVVDEAKKSDELQERVAAAVVERDFPTADALLTPEVLERESRRAFRLYTLQGDRWYFANVPDKAIEPYETALRLRPDEIRARNNVTLAHISARLGDIAAHRRRVIEIAEGTLVRLQRGSLAWAGTQVNIGLGWATMPTGSISENIRRALTAYDAALSALTKDIHPFEWAMVHMNLGDAWQKLPTGNRAANVREAVRAYRAAFSILTRTRYPLEWGTAKNDLGNAWRSMPIGNLGRHILKAIRCYGASLTICTKDRHPDRWAMAQFNLGAAWQSLPTGNRSENLQKAIEAYEKALTIRTKPSHPAEWAMAQCSLGSAWYEMPTGDRHGNLSRAIDAFELALTVYTEEHQPLEWARTQNNLGLAMLHLPASQTDENVRRAISALNAAVRKCTREGHPLEWAVSQSNLGGAWAALRTGDRAENMNQATAAFEAALTVLTPDTHPVEWSTAQMCLGNALTEVPLGNIVHNVEKAIDAYKVVLDVRTREDRPVDWAFTQSNLAAALVRLAVMRGEDRCDLLRESISRAKGSLCIRTADAFPADHQFTSNILESARHWYGLFGCSDQMPFDHIPPAG